jgi:hypothetical protein
MLNSSVFRNWDRHKMYMTVACVVEGLAASGIAALAGPLNAALCLIAWVGCYLLFAPFCFRETASTRRLASHVLWCLCSCGSWCVAMLAPRISSLYVPNRIPAWDCDILRATLRLGAGLLLYCVLQRSVLLLILSKLQHCDRTPTEV